MSFSLDFDSLPTLPVILQQVMTEINNTQSSIKDIASIVERDQSMSAKILKLVNSAFYGFPKRIGTISHAVSILGFETVKSLVLGVAILDAFKIQEFNMFSFWEHSIKTASLSAYFAKKMSYPSPDEAFVVGLIHDIGKLIFMMSTLGSPGCEMSAACFSCGCKLSNDRINSNLVSEDVGPFRVYALRPFVDALTRVFTRVQRDNPSLYQSLSSAGALCCRPIKKRDGTAGSSYSNHSWGVAIDIKIDGELDRRGDGMTQRGLLSCPSI